MSPTWPLEIENTLTLAEQGGRTVLTLRAVPEGASEAERDTFAAAHKSVQKGFAGTFDQLAEYLAQARKG